MYHKRIGDKGDEDGMQPHVREIATRSCPGLTDDMAMQCNAAEVRLHRSLSGEGDMIERMGWRSDLPSD